MGDASGALLETVRDAFERGAPLEIVGGGTKRFLGREPHGAVLSTRKHCGIVSFEPSELVLTARAGTPLREIEAALAEAHQHLAFEPPHFGADATLGGAVASGLAGPRRAYAGSVKDFVLGATLISGEGKRLRFGGRVMKNVAGFDVSRFMAGSFGTLGILLEISLKVLPRPPFDATLNFDVSQAEALSLLNAWSRQANSISASCWCEGVLSIRLSGSPAAIAAAHAELGGERTEEPDAENSFWKHVREHSHPFFAQTSVPLIRIAVPASAPPLIDHEPCLIEWGGAQRWYRGGPDAEAFARLVRAAADARGFAVRTRAPTRDGVTLSEPAAALHRSLKAVFDPKNILNPGRMSAQF